MKLIVQLVTWNGEKYIPYLFESLKKQKFRDWKLIILDNGSSDKTVEKIKEQLKEGRLETNYSVVDVELVEGEKNLGFAGGHNYLFTHNQSSSTNYVLLLNQDMYLEPDCLEKMVAFMDAHTDVGAVSPRLMKWDFGSLQTADYKLQDSFSNKIDTLGLKILRNRRVIEKYTGKDWKQIEPKMALSFRAERWRGEGIALEVFGVSGALPMYRTSAIDKVGLFDELYGSYKEDVDLAYRLRIGGYKAFVLLDTVAYHDRSATGIETKGDNVAVENKKKQSELVKYHSYKNHLITIYKNEYVQNWLLDAVFIKWYEFKKFIYFLFFDRAVLRGLGEIWKNKKELKKKRQEVKKIRKISWKEVRKWWR